MGSRTIVASAPEARWARRAAPRSTSKRTSPFTRKIASAPERSGAASRSAPPVPAMTGSSETARAIPSVSAASRAARAMSAGRWWTFTTARRTPAPARRASENRTSGRPHTGTAGFGTRSVSGRSRVPSPAQRTMPTVSPNPPPREPGASPRRRDRCERCRPRPRRACARSTSSTTGTSARSSRSSRSTCTGSGSPASRSASSRCSPPSRSRRSWRSHGRPGRITARRRSGRSVARRAGWHSPSSSFPSRAPRRRWQRSSCSWRSAIARCRDSPGVSYARIRLFGSLGFIVLTVLVGRLLTARGGRPADLLLPVTVVLCVCAYALVARGVPATPRHAERPAPREMLTLLRDRRLWILLGPAAIHWAACAPYHVFFGVLVRDLKLPDDVTSAGMATGVVAEILVLLAFPRLERRFPLRRLLAVSFVVSAVRWALLARATAPLAVAGLQALHGLTFGLFWGSAMRALADVVPPRLRATGQAVFTGVVFGGANAVGTALSGVGYDRLGGAAPLFGWAAALELVALAVLLAASRLAPGQARAGASAGP